MASQKQLDKTKELLTKYISTVQSNSLRREYQKNFNAIQDDALKILERTGKLTKADMDRIVQRHKIVVDNLLKIVVFAIVLAGTELVIDNVRSLKTKQRKELQPIFEMMNHRATAKSINPRKFQPLTLVKTINKHVNTLLKGNQVNKEVLTGQQVSIVESLDKYVQSNNTLIKNLAKQQEKAFGKLNDKIVDNLSKQMSKDVRRFRKQLIKGEPPTNKNVEDKMNKKYANAATSVDRVLRTEVHTQNELTKLANARHQNFTKKTWKNNPTAGKGGKVRHNRFANHLVLNNKTVAIKTKFKLRTGKAKFPGDLTLGAADRINCRCTVEYS